MKTYCEGLNCLKRDTCAKHQVTSGDWCEYIDWSNYGGGHYWVDEDGKAHCKTWTDCGDAGNYKLYMEFVDQIGEEL